MDNPCQGCVPPRRHLYCHDRCPDRALWLADLEKKREYLKVAKEVEEAKTDYRDQTWHKVTGWRINK